MEKRIPDTRIDRSRPEALFADSEPKDGFTSGVECYADGDFINAWTNVPAPGGGRTQVNNWVSVDLMIELLRKMGRI